MTGIADLPAPPSPDGRDLVVPATAAQWRRWLARHPGRADGVWVVHRKKGSALVGPTYDDLLDEALSTAGSTAAGAAWTRADRIDRTVQRLAGDDQTP